MISRYHHHHHHHLLRLHLFNWYLHRNLLHQFLPSPFPHQHFLLKFLLHFPPSPLPRHLSALSPPLLHQLLQSLLLHLFQKYLLLKHIPLHHLALTLRQLRPSLQNQTHHHFLQNHLTPSLRSLPLHTPSLPGQQSQVQSPQDHLSKSFHHRSLWCLNLQHPPYHHLYGHQDSTMQINGKSLKCLKKLDQMKMSGISAEILCHQRVLKAE